MSAPIRFTVPLPPLGKQRARMGGAKGDGKVRRWYTPEKTKKAEADIAMVARPHAPRTPFTGAVRLLVICDMAEPTAKPDGDNVLKLVSDALNGVMWVDDCQVVDARVMKRRASSPSITIEVESL